MPDAEAAALTAKGVFNERGSRPRPLARSAAPD
ncbi:MAG: hypothetical protein DK306_000517 [Chloroflexi bacterium]|nr:MAG: hypothetical protein DK306_000517 [Chloroflexota bacterium]